MAVEVEKLIVRLVGDSTQYQQTLKTAEAATKTSAKQIETASTNMGGLTDKGGQAARTLQRLAPAFDVRAIISSSQSAEQALGAVGHMGSSVAMSFGPIGMAASVGIGLAIAAVTLLSKLMKDDLQERANKAFESVIDGSKRASQAIAEIKVEILNEGLQETANLVRRLNDPGNMAGLMLGVEGAARVIAESVAEAVQQAERAQDLVRQLAADPNMQRLRIQAIGARAEVNLEAITAELELRRDNVGLTQEQIRLEEIRRDLQAANLPTAGVDAARAMLDWTNAMETAHQALTEVNNELNNFGMTAVQVQAAALEAAGAFEEAVELLLAENRLVALQTATQEWSDALEEASSIISGARTPAEQYADTIANIMRLVDAGAGELGDFANAIDAARVAFEQADPATQAWRRQVEEGMNVIRGLQSPVEIAANQIAALGAAYEAGEIELEDYTDALERMQSRLIPANNQLQRTNELLQATPAAAARSAEALSRIAAYSDRLGGRRAIGGANQAATAVAGGGLQARGQPVAAVDPAQQRVIDLLTLSLNQLQTIATRPQIEVQGAGLN